MLVSQKASRLTTTPPDTNDSSQQDYPYLSPLIEEIEAEMKEREDLESMVVRKNKEGQ